MHLRLAFVLAALPALVCGCNLVFGVDGFDALEVDESAATTGTGTSPEGCRGQCGTQGCGTCPSSQFVFVENDFGMQKTEVTIADYALFVEARVALDTQPPSCAWNDDFDNGSSHANFPQQQPRGDVDWCDAAAYCQWIGARLCGARTGGAAPFDQPNDPAASQWYAGCAGSMSQKYPYGDTYDAMACKGVEVGDSLPIDAGTMPGCVRGGILDLSGNVGEWTDSCNGDGEFDACWVRGGHYGDTGAAMSCDDGNVARQRDQSSDRIGFRCCQG